MKCMRDSAVIGLAQWLPAAGQPEKNLRTALDLIGGAARRGCDLVVLPELWVCGYNRESLADDVRSAAQRLAGGRVEALAGAARELGLWIATGSMPEVCGDAIYNTALLLDREGRCLAAHRKMLLFPGEERIFAAGSEITTCATDEFGVVGVAVCFDGDFPETARAMAERGASVVVHSSAYGIAYKSWWELLYPANALLNGQWWLMANQCGVTSSAVLLGESQIISPSGEVVCRAKGSEALESPRPEVVVAEVSLQGELERVKNDNRPLRTHRPRGPGCTSATEQLS